MNYLETLYSDLYDNCSSHSDCDDCNFKETCNLFDEEYSFCNTTFEEFREIMLKEIK